MLIKPGIAVSEMSGKFGGVVAAHNRFGQYFRQYRIPTDPQSSSQMLRRANMAAGVAAWGELTEAEKETWNVYAANTPWVNRLGEEIYLNGFQHYLRVVCFFRAIYNEFGGDEPDISSCGSTGGLPENISGAVATLSVATGLSLAYEDSAAWCSSDGFVCLIRMSRPRPGTRVYGNGPYRICSTIVGSLATPATSPHAVATASLPWSISEGDRVDFLARMVTADMTLSNALKISALVVA
jgi:hypothetical protein